ncbi:hypothetical protein KEM56_006148, partial [Ascosphaera pollenicola]
PADKHVLDRAQVRILELFNDLDVVELDVEELVDALEHAPDLDISISRLLNNGRDLKKEQCDPKGDWNVLRRDRNEGFAKPRRIRYLHVPSNNMA